jgi:hypothetical protein
MICSESIPHQVAAPADIIAPVRLQTNDAYQHTWSSKVEKMRKPGGPEVIHIATSRVLRLPDSFRLKAQDDLSLFCHRIAAFEMHLQGDRDARHQGNKYMEHMRRLLQHIIALSALRRIVPAPSFRMLNLPLLNFGVMNDTYIVQHMCCVLIHGAGRASTSKSHTHPKPGSQLADHMHAP